MPAANQIDGMRGSHQVADRFEARNEAAELVAVEKLAASAEENALGGLEWSGAGVRYQLEDGSEVERVGESHFRIVRTGEVLRRIEGDHGISHHQKHQTPAKP